MSIINKAAVLNPFSSLTSNTLDYVPRATTSAFGIVAIGSGINVDALGRIYLDTQEYSDRLTAIEAQASSSLATQQTEVAAAIAQVNLTQSQTITALSLEVSNLKTDLTSSITATQTDLINRADQLAQDVTDITVQLTQDKATFTQEIQDALDYLQDEASVASALRTPRKIQGVDFDGTQDISLPVFSTQIDGLVPKREGVTTTKYLREDGTWVIPANTAYALLTKASAEDGTATAANTISAQVLKEAIQYHAPTVTNIVGNAETASKLQTSRTISLTGGVTGSVSFDGSAHAPIATTITGLGLANGIATLDSSGQVPSTQLPSYVDDVLEYENVAAFPATGETGKIYVETAGNITYRWSGTGYVKITSGEVSSVAGKTGVVTLTKSDVGLSNVDNTSDATKSVASAAKLTTARTINGVSFDGTSNITVADSTKAPLDSANLIGTPTAPTATTTTNTTQLATTAFVQSVNTADTGSSATTLKLKTARTIGGVSFDGSANINLPGVNTIGNQSTTGNAATATALATARTINGVSFNGSADITVADDTKLPLAGGTLTGALNVNNTTASTSATTGAITTTGGVGIGGALFTTGAITSANNITAYSDSRIKDNIIVIDDALNKVSKLKGVTYNRIDVDDKDKRYVGLIAQDVQSVMPEAVTVHKDVNQTLSVDYQGLVGLLVEAVKELESKVAALEGR